MLGITKGHDWGWTSGRTIGVFAAAAVLLIGFIGQESRPDHPLMPFSIFRLQTLTAANIVMFIMGTALFSMFLMLTLYMQQVLHFSPLKTGVGYLAVAGTAIIWANVAAAAVTRVGVKPTLVVGMSVMTVGLVLFTQVSADGSYWKNLFPGFLVIGFGMPLAFVSLTIAALAGTRAARGRPRLRPDQHVAADRRRGRDRDPLHDRHLDDERRGRVGDPGAGGADPGVPERVLGRRGDHLRRRPRLAPPRPADATSRRRPLSSPRPTRPDLHGRAGPTRPPVASEACARAPA